MKTRLRHLARHAPLLLCASVLHGQQTTPASSTTDDRDAIELSPFVVDSSVDEGYGSTVTTAASRLKTDLKDIAASVSVLTNEFMDDLGAIDVAGALAFVAGAENDSTYHQENVASLGSANGYVGGDFGDNNNRSGEVRVRGLGRATTTINYIEVLGATDRYNTDRSELLRGANSILFGLAEPAGLVNSSTKIANTRRNSGRIETKFDNFGSNRVVADFNQVLVKDVLAVRAVALHNDTRYQVKTAFQEDHRIFLTSTFQPYSGTTIRAYFEGNDTSGRRPNFRTVQDNVSEWLSLYNTYAPQLTQAQLDAAFFWDPLIQTGGTPPASTFTLANGTPVNLGLIRRPLDTQAGGTTLIYSPGQWENPLDNVVTIMRNRTIAGGNGSPLRQFARSGAARENSAFFSADPQVTDTGIFPFRTTEIGALPGNYRQEDGRKFYFTVDQRISKDFYVSASYQRETRELEQYFGTITQTNQISLDITKNLPDGRANPNFLRPFIYGRPLGEYNDGVAQTWVVQANYDFDFAKKTERFGWLGLHRLTGVFNDAEVDRLGYRWHYQVINDIPGVLPAAGNTTTSANRWSMQMWYVGDPVQVGDTALRFTGFPTNVANQWDRSYTYRFFNNTVTPNAWQTSPEPVRYERHLVGGGRTYTIQKNDGVGLSLQSFFWDRRIITLFGWRRDNVDSFTGILPLNSTFPFGSIPGATREEYLPEGSIYTNSADTATKSIVYKITDNLRVFANESENFAATTPRQDPLYRNLGPQSGNTEELGVGLTLFENRLDLRLGWFKSSQDDATSATAVAGLRIAGFENNLYNAIQAAGRLAEWTTISPLGVPTSDPYQRAPNAASTEDRISKGASLEISYRPNRNWDIVASVSQLDNEITDVGREVADFLEVRAPFYKRYFDEGLRLDGSTTNTGSSFLAENFATNVAAQYVGEINREGTSNRGISEWNAMFVGRYKFLEGRLKGITLGSNVRWESGKIIGYGQKDELFNIGGLTNFPGRVAETSIVHKSGSVIAGGVFATYTRKLNDRITWRLQFNAQNLFGETGLRLFAANPDGSPIWAVNPARSYEISNTFSF